MLRSVERPGSTRLFKLRRTFDHLGTLEEPKRPADCVRHPLNDAQVRCAKGLSELISQRRQLTNEAGMTKGATAGSIAIATGCVAASALGQAYIALPCVIGGALYTGAVKLAR